MRRGGTIALAPDPALPARDACLDPAPMAAILARIPGVEAPVPRAAVRVARVKYRRGESLRVLYELATPGGCARISLRTDPLGLGRAGPSRSAGACHHDARLGASLWVFPADRKLRGLDRLMEPDAAPVRGRVPDGARATLVAYAPEKAATVRFDHAGRPVRFAKRLRNPEDGARLAALTTALAAVAPPGLVPAGAEHDARSGNTWVAPVAGAPLSALPPGLVLRATAAFGAALAALHGLDAPCEAPSPRTCLPRLERAAALVAAARPDLAGMAWELFERLAETAPAPWGEPVCLHGDLHPKNALYAGGRVSLVDLEHCGRGERAVDLGSFVAALRAEALVRHTPAVRSTAQPRETAFLAGYAAGMALPPSAVLAWHIAASLLAERALRAVNRVRPAVLVRLPQLLAHARGLLEGQRHG